ncbi:ankyrin repeat domain-containing protein 50-like [Canna indica]|uniref:Ankyrin repeat domain-containing protein 50-like n=1 Tax=Canna indica TaxID=4628 RepID=A0AAQ3KRA6_9LILI|nr:ankyrin repeat domain-containing protein 50-like [Canna indica]
MRRSSDSSFLRARWLTMEERQRDCAKLLLVTGVRVDARGGADGGTPLRAITTIGDEAMVKLLLFKGIAGVKEVQNAAG